MISSKRDMQTMRRFPVGGGFEQILVFYYPYAKGIDIVRVVHGRRDLGRLKRKGFLR